MESNQVVEPITAFARVRVVGCQYRRGWNNDGFIGDASSGAVGLLLKQEPTNKYDPTAIAVYFDGKQCGYVASDWKEGAEFLMEHCEDYATDENGDDCYTTLCEAKVSDIKTDRNGVVQNFEAVLTATVHPDVVDDLGIAN